MRNCDHCLAAPPGEYPRAEGKPRFVECGGLGGHEPAQGDGAKVRKDRPQVLRVADLVSKPAWLLHEMDIGADRIGFLPVARHLLQRAGFLDGREPISVGEPVALSVAQALTLPLPPSDEPDRMLFHVSFCGSTLLTRMIERPGKVLVLREPHGPVGLADWKAKRGHRPDPRIRRLADLARASLRARWQRAERIVVKPTNWCNNLIPELCGPDVRPLFVTIAPRNFLRAVFRGNRDRIAFTILAAQHFAAGAPADAALIAAALRDLPDSLDRACAMVLLALHFQERAFRAAMAEGGWGDAHLIDYERLAGAPFEAAEAANRALDLGLSADEVAEAVARNTSRDAKLAGRAFSAEGQDGVNDAIEHAHARHFDAALAWAAANVPDPAAAPPELPERRGRAG